MCSSAAGGCVTARLVLVQLQPTACMHAVCDAMMDPHTTSISLHERDRGKADNVLRQQRKPGALISQILLKPPNS